MRFKRIITVLILAICLAVFPLGSLTALADANARYGIIQIGDEDSIIYEVQQMLSGMGLLIKAPDGVFDDETKQGVDAFQLKSEMPGGGTLDDATLRALLGADMQGYFEGMTSQTLKHTLVPGDTDLKIGTLKRRMIQLGYLLPNTAISAKYDDALKGAVSEFTRQNGFADVGLQQEVFQAVFSGGAAGFALQLGDAGDAVQAMQLALQEQQYLTEGSYLSGLFDGVTQDAVIAFQQAEGLMSSGKADGSTLSVLYGVHEVSDGPVVEEVALLAPMERSVQMPIVPAYKLELTPNFVSEVASANAADQVIGDMLSFAKLQLGKPYVYSAEGPNSFDCSGFVYYVLVNMGVDVTRTNAATFSAKEQWARVSRSDLAAGDLVFFYDPGTSRVGHTGIYLGDNEYIHASSSGGAVVISSASSSYFKNNFVCGRRVF